MKETGPNLIKNKLLQTIFLLTRESLLKIDDLNADSSTNIYLDSINILLSMHLLKELINTSSNLSLNLR